MSGIEIESMVTILQCAVEIAQFGARFGAVAEGNAEGFAKLFRVRMGDLDLVGAEVDEVGICID